MPRIELIQPVYYGPNDPIHWEIDNLPLKNIIRRQNLINLSLDDVIEVMRDAIGTQGTLANRLNQSINANGTLKSSAIDLAQHSIEEHTDTDDYVRMSKAQSDKLDLIADQATNFSLQIYTDSTNFVEFPGGVLKIKPSSTVTPSFESPNILKLELGFPTEAAHRHFYGLEPVSVDDIDPDYMNYKVNSLATPFIEGSLRIYVNGSRIFENTDIYVPGRLVDDPWTLLYFTPSESEGTFVLSEALSEDDKIRIDFDVSLV